MDKAYMVRTLSTTLSKKLEKIEEKIKAYGVPLSPAQELEQLTIQENEVAVRLFKL